MSKKNAILLAATELFSQKGYDGASMAELSRMTGAAGGTIFHHFKNKEDLFLNILGGIKETILSAFDQYLKDANFRNGLELVEGAVSFYLQLASRMQAQFLLLHRHFPYKMAEANPVCRDYLESIYDCLLDIFEKGILMGQKDGSVDGVPARQSAMILFSMVDGIARFNTYQLYDAGALYSALMAACRKMIGLKRPTDDDAVT
ncbi:MAG: TetR/AcrR family transcriptional regulator [Deltaproteobacteria bacterium]|nr:TetR/AcrR family transcriptional regulator [Deltaproteobacteria bacterium]MBW2175867.1 TetR/AcrR family transcriptional regulator [Deltaproteobacteria bacterium]